jgi:Leucine-rich repeat (LRR) protein
MITICGEEYSADITELNLSYKQLTAIPEEIKYLTNLQKLYLCNNEITTIPKHIFDPLINLHKLSFSCNKITSIPEHAFDNLINLHTLSFWGNQITTIPEHLFDNLISLFDLSFFKNKITTIPISILRCQWLAILDFGSNPIEHIDVRIQRFINELEKDYNDRKFDDYPEVQTSVDESTNNLMKDTIIIDKDDETMSKDERTNMIVII